MKIDHEHVWEEQDKIGNCWCKICGRKLSWSFRILSELSALPDAERDEIIMLIRNKYRRFKIMYGDGAK